MEVVSAGELHCLSALLAEGACPALAWPALLAAIPVRLVWSMAVLSLGVVLIVSVALILKREGKSMGQLRSGAAGESGQHVRRLSRLLRAIRSLDSIIVTERDDQQLLEKACQSLVMARGYRMAWIGLINEGTKRVVPVAQAGFEEGYLGQIEVTWDDSPTGQGPTGRAIKTAEPVVMRDIESAPEFRPWRTQALQRCCRSSAALPLRFAHQVVGALNVYSEVPDAFNIEEIGVLQEVADHLAYALTAIRLEQELAETKRKARETDRLLLALENSPLGMVVTDSSGMVTNINRRMMEFLNGCQSQEEIVGVVRMPDLAVFGDSAARTGIQEVLGQGKPARFECETVVADGSRHVLSCQGMPVLEDGERPTGALWLVEDISDRSAPEAFPG